MIACVSGSSYLAKTVVTATGFDSMIPQIERVASYGFRFVPRPARDELISDVLSTAYVAYVRLVELGKAVLAYPTVLARFAIRQVRAGRRVAARQNVRDVLSPLAQRRHGFAVERLTEREALESWEQLTANRHATPAEMAAFRIDFRHWLGHLKPTMRRIALDFAKGDTTTEVARQLNVSAPRVSQLRRELAENWYAFQHLAYSQEGPLRL